MLLAGRIAALVLGLVCAYAVLSALPAGWIGLPWRLHHFLFHNERFRYWDVVNALHFQVVFMPVVGTSLYWLFTRRMQWCAGIWHVFLIGAIIGYGAGVIAFPFVSLLNDLDFTILMSGWRHFPEAMVIGLIVPLLFGCWLFGGIAAVITWLPLRKTAKGVTVE